MILFIEEIKYLLNSNDLDNYSKCEYLLNRIRISQDYYSIYYYDKDINDKFIYMLYNIVSDDNIFEQYIGMFSYKISIKEEFINKCKLSKVLKNENKENKIKI